MEAISLAASILFMSIAAWDGWRRHVASRSVELLDELEVLTMAIDRLREKQEDLAKKILDLHNRAALQKR